MFRLPGCELGGTVILMCGSCPRSITFLEKAFLGVPPNPPDPNLGGVGGEHSALADFLGVFFFFFGLFRAAPKKYGSSQARGRIGAVAATAMPNPSGVWTYTTSHSKNGSLTH